MKATQIQTQQRMGTVRAHPKGFGFVETDNKEESFFIPPPLMQTLLTEDRIAFEVEQGPFPGQESVSTVELIHRPETYWLGALSGMEGLSMTFTPDEAVNCEMRLPRGIEGKAGDIVQVRVAEGTGAAASIAVTVVANLGPRNDREFDTKYAKAKYRLPSTWSEQALSEAHAIAQALATPDASAVTDLRHLPFVTVDGESTKDVDDAIYVKALANGGFQLYVGIADVSRFVPQGSALDREARSRATSVYFPDEVLPMLPTVLSNGVCSLNPGVDRYALVAELQVMDGKIASKAFYPAVIQSRAKLTYTGVTRYQKEPACLQELLPAGASEQVRTSVKDNLDALASLRTAMEPFRAVRGLHEHRNPEPNLNIEADGEYGLKWEEPTIAHEMVEECMLLANQAAAMEMIDRNGSKLFRHHVGVDPLKWADARTWLEEQGFSTPDTPTLTDLKALLTQAKNHPRKESVDWRVRRTLTFAVYSVEAPSHYSLEFEAYTHFTSPIRRYADLMVHRVLKGEVIEDLEATAAHCSEASRQADLASRGVMDRIKKRNLWRHAKHCKLVGQVAVANRNGLKVVVEGWETVVLVSQWTNLREHGLRWDKTREEWLRHGQPLALGATVWVKPTQLEQVKNQLDVQGTLEGLFATSTQKEAALEIA